MAIVPDAESLNLSIVSSRSRPSPLENVKVALVSLLVSSSRGEKMSIQSTWTADPVVIDGNVSEWQSRCSISDGNNIATTVMNDSQSIYIFLVSENERFNRQAFISSFSSGSAASKVQAAHDLIAQYVNGTEPEQRGYTFLTSPADFESAFTSLNQFISKQSIAIDSISGSAQ